MICQGTVKGMLMAHKTLLARQRQAIKDCNFRDSVDLNNGAVIHLSSSTNDYAVSVQTTRLVGPFIIFLHGLNAL